MVKVLFAVLAVLIGNFESKAETCIASVYSLKDRGGKFGSTGERLSDGAFTAAHKKLKIGTKVRVTNLSNHKYTIARINDRGPYVKGRCIDLRPAVAKAIGCNGLCRVSVE